MSEIKINGGIRFNLHFYFYTDKNNIKKKEKVKWLLWPFVIENGRSSKEVEKNRLKMRTGKPGRDRISAVKNLALWNDGVVDFGGGVVGEVNGGAWESGEEIFQEMDFEEIVEKA